MGSVLEVVLASPPLGVREDPDLGLDNVVDPTIVHSIVLPVGASLGPLTTPPVTEVWSDTIPLVAGAFTIDLEALVGSNLPVIDMTGLRVQVFQFSCPEANGNLMQITAGAVDGYDLGGPSMNWRVLPGDTMLLVLNDNAPDVAPTNSQIDIAGTGTDIFEILIAAG